MSHTHKGHPHKAVRDSSLVAFMHHGAGRACVIVEARRDKVAPTAAARAHRPAGSPAPHMQELESQLGQLGLAQRARRNDLTGSFVLEVTPDELRDVAALPAVQAIRRNRFHRRVAA